MADVGGRIIERFASNLAVQCAGGAPVDAAAGARMATADGGPGAGTASGAGPAAAADGAPLLPIEDLQLPVRTFNSLRREGIHTVRDLSARSEADLLTIPNLGPQSVSEIKQKLAEQGFALASAAGAGTAASAGPTGTAAAPPQAARPPDEDAIDLLSVAGFPVLKRALPIGVVAAVVITVLLLGRRRRRRRA